MLFEIIYTKLCIAWKQVWNAHVLCVIFHQRKYRYTSIWHVHLSGRSRNSMKGRQETKHWWIQGDAIPISFQLWPFDTVFAQKNCQNNRLAPLPLGPTPVWEILDPPLQKHEILSSTVNEHRFLDPFLHHQQRWYLCPYPQSWNCLSWLI